MDHSFTFSEFLSRFPTDEACLEEIKRHRYPKGIYCRKCRKNTKHYRIKNRQAYSCTFCRNHVFPLSGTLFEKSSTPLRVWFFALFLMTHTRASISKKRLQKELDVTYKTAWRLHKSIKILMERNHGDLLFDPSAYMQDEYKERKWLFFNKLEIRVVHKQESSDEEEVE